MEMVYAPKEGLYARRVFKINYVPVGNHTADWVDSVTKGTEFRQIGHALFTNIAEVVKDGRGSHFKPIGLGSKTFSDIFDLAVVQDYGIKLKGHDLVEEAIADLFS